MLLIKEANLCEHFGATGIQGKRKRERERNTGTGTCTIVVIRRILHQ